MGGVLTKADLGTFRGPTASVDTQQPRLLLLIHTEEEFDWDQGFDRRATGLSHIPSLPRFCDAALKEGFQPNFLCGYPVAKDDKAATVIASYLAPDKANLGAHLHPWICPPHEEAITVQNSFHANLPPALERAKIELLTGALHDRFGIQPISFLSGRYGIGPQTAYTLATLGYRVDLSLMAGADYRNQYGPDFRHIAAIPFWNKSHDQLLHIPHSGGQIGWLTKAGQSYLPIEKNKLAEKTKLAAVMARLKASRRAVLSFEGFPLSDTKTLATELVAAGQRLLTYSFHSPTAGVGYTPYARTEEDRNACLSDMVSFLQFFRDELGGVSTTPEDAYILCRPPSGEASR